MAALASDYAEDLLLGAARDTHAAVARRAFGLTRLLTGGSSGASQRIHDSVTGAVYGGLGAGLRGAGRALRAADRAGIGARFETSPRGRHTVAALNGLIGDRLRDGDSEFTIEMAVRRRSQDVPLTVSGLREAYPSPTGDLVVFVHGLGENEHFWHRNREETGGTYADTLAAEGRWTPVFLRVNTGLPIAENGVALASLLDRLVAAWPTDVRRIAFIGHSMGGLIVRAACAVDTRSDSPWTDLVTDVVTLGTPHLGAPLERTVDVGARLLGRLPEAAPFGRILEYRSTGILDLRQGLSGDVVNLPNARYHLVAATLAASRRHPVSQVLGDMLVRYPSALGRPRRGEEMFPGADVLHIRGGHFALLNHPDVHDALRRWLA